MAKAKLHEIRIRPAEGGVSVETEHRTKRSGQGGGALHDYETERSVHTSPESLHEHLAKHLKGHFSAESEESEERGDKEE